LSALAAANSADSKSPGGKSDWNSKLFGKQDKGRNLCEFCLDNNLGNCLEWALGVLLLLFLSKKLLLLLPSSSGV